MVALASCSLDHLGNIVSGGNAGNNSDNTSTFDEDVENPQGLEFFLKDDGTYAVGVGSAKYLSKIVIPTTYKGKAVTEIASFFADTDINRANSTIKEVVIPDTVTTIGEYAFYSCYSLTSVVIPDSVTSIGDYAFSHCSGLTSVVIPDSVTSIGDYVFSHCSGLTSVVIPDSVTSIGNGAFLSCYSLTSVVIPDSVTSIVYYAFSHCSSLTSVVIPDSVTSIGYYAFSHCSSLTSVVIPDSVTSIGDSAFYYCSSLTSIKYRGTREEWKAISKSFGWNSNIGNYTLTFNYDGE